MVKDEFIQKIQEIGQCEDDAQRLSMLAELSDEGSKIYDDFDEVSASNKKYIDDNETLRKANMDLFLRVGQKKDTTPDITNIQKEEKEARRCHRCRGAVLLSAGRCSGCRHGDRRQRHAPPDYPFHHPQG